MEKIKRIAKSIVAKTNAINAVNKRHTQDKNWEEAKYTKYSAALKGMEIICNDIGIVVDYDYETLEGLVPGTRYIAITKVILDGEEFATKTGEELAKAAELTPEEELLQLLEEHEDKILEAGEKALLEALQNPWQQTGVDITADGRIVMWYDTAGGSWHDTSMTRIVTFDGDRLGEPEEDDFEDRDEWAGWYAAEFGCSAAYEQLKRLRERLEYDAAERKWLRQHMGW